MIGSVEITEGLFVAQELDAVGHLEIRVDDYSASIWLDRSEVLALITHLGKVLDDADEEAMK